MPSIPADRWRTLQPLLDDALERPAHERAAWLESVRRSHPEVAADLEALLAAEDDADQRRFLADPVAMSLAGLRIGAYILETPLGSGGMGSVWLARRADGRFEGRAAVKLMNLALLSPTGQERFRREGTMLARLAHPGIARLLDAGVGPSGQPYLVIEHVDGERIDSFADARRLGVEERIGLVLQVLDAVGHAHANLIVHRDIKPSNILVTTDGTVKLLDFGIGKLLEGEHDAERTGLTIDGGALTPEYAAPEQVRGQPVGTATDTYAIGVLLYVLLTGRRPYDVHGRTPAEVERIICELDPPRPSENFTGKEHDARHDDAQRALARGTTPDRLRRRLRDDLDLIILKSMHKDPARRYTSATALREELGRYREGLPVRARPDSAAYRLGKFVRRNRTAVVAGSAIVTLLASAALRERALRSRAEAEATKSRAVQEYVVSVFDVADPFAWPEQRGENVTARTLLDRGARRIDTALVTQPEVQAELRGVLGRVYSKLGLFGDAIPHLERSLQQRRALHGPRHVVVAQAMDQLGEALRQQSQLDRAEPLLRDALALRRELLGNRDAATAESLDHVATLLQGRSKYDEAEPLFRQALAIRRDLPVKDDLAVASSLTNLGLLLWFKGAYDLAEPIQREALAIQSARLGEDHPLTAQTLNNLATVEQFRGEVDEAEVLFRRALSAKRKALGDAHPSVTLAMNNLAFLLWSERGKLAEAETLTREALRLDRQIFGPRHEYVASSLTALGNVLTAKGEFEEAERAYRDALAMRRSMLGARHTTIARNLGAIGNVRYVQGDLDAAIAQYHESVAMYRTLFGETHVNYLLTSVSLARALVERGSPDDDREAEPLLRAALQKLDASKPAQYTALVTARVGLGRMLTRRAQSPDAAAMLERALAMSQERYGLDHWRTAEARLVLGECLTAAGQRPRGEQLIRDAFVVLAKQGKSQPHLASVAAAAVQRER